MSFVQQITGRVPVRSLTIPSSKTSSWQTLPLVICRRNYSDVKPKTSTPVKEEAQKVKMESSEEIKPKKKTQAELDAEVMAKLAGHDSEGGEAGIEYEDGKPASMKRSVKNNMFRYI